MAGLLSGFELDADLGSAVGQGTGYKKSQQLVDRIDIDPHIREPIALECLQLLGAKEQLVHSPTKSRQHLGGGDTTEQELLHTKRSDQRYPGAGLGTQQLHLVGNPAPVLNRQRIAKKVAR